jgi:Icc-related predicted phosphoesterase
MRIAAAGDLHCTKENKGRFQPVLTQIRDRADVVVLCGDLTDFGLPEEAEILAQELRQNLSTPILAVLGNHDYESGRAEEVRRIFSGAGIKILDGESVELNGVGFAGAKGFGGGFGERVLQPWGEKAIKDYVQETIQESLKLESALARLKTAQKVVLLHYSPTASTVEGEPLEIYPFVGTSRLEEPIDRHGATLVLHGHAHHGTPEGRTKGNVPVYNVAMPLLARAYPNLPPFRIIDLPSGS